MIKFHAESTRILYIHYSWEFQYILARLRPSLVGNMSDAGKQEYKCYSTYRASLSKETKRKISTYQRCNTIL